VKKQMENILVTVAELNRFTACEDLLDQIISDQGDLILNTYMGLYPELCKQAGYVAEEEQHSL
jgi:hypothetical protein